MMTLGFKYNDIHGWKWGKEIKFRYASLSISPPLFLLFTQSFPSTLSLPLLGALLPKPIGSLGSTVSCPAKPDRERFLKHCQLAITLSVSSSRRKCNNLPRVITRSKVRRIFVEILFQTRYEIKAVDIASSERRMNLPPTQVLQCCWMTITVQRSSQEHRCLATRVSAI